MAAVAAVLGLREFYRLVSSAGACPWPLGGMGGAVALLGAAAADGVWVVASVSGGGALATLVAVLVARRSLPKAMAGWSVTVAGVLYLGLPLTYAVVLRQGVQGADWLLLALLATFSTDTAAFVVGRALGRRSLTPKLSPGKTWEGAVGGLLGGTGVTVALVSVLDLPFVAWAAVLLGVGIGLLAQVGDLMESRLKRLARAKEAGGLVPGHGGLLDRMDSLVLVFPLVYYVARSWPEA